MSQCGNRHFALVCQNESLPKNARQKTEDAFCNGAPLCARRGSFTLEAAVVIPLTAAFLAALLFFFRVLQIQTAVSGALSYAGRKSAAASSFSDSETAELAAAKLYFLKTLSKDENIDRYVRGGKLGISLAGSDFCGEYIALEAAYEIQLPVHFFSVRGIPVIQKSVNRKWTGESADGEEADPFVYITPEGTVYHLSTSCHYLDLSIQTVKSAEIGRLRNQNGHKYYACERCAAENPKQKDLYITDYGTVYHASLQCSGLKRTIYEVRLSEVGTRGACSKCAAGKKK